MNSRLHPTVRRGDLFYAELGETVGSEQKGRRPVLVIQNDVGNANSPTVIVAVLTSKVKKMYMPTHLLVGRKEGLPERSMVLFEQIITIDRQRLREHLGTCDANFMKRADQAIKESLELR